MGTTIITKNGSGAPAASDLVAGELAVDLTNKRLYTEDSGANILELGSNPSTIVVAGTSTLTGNVTASSDVSVGGNLTVTGNATIEGNLTFGNAATDTITTADVASSIVPVQTTPTILVLRLLGVTFILMALHILTQSTSMGQL